MSTYKVATTIFSLFSLGCLSGYSIAAWHLQNETLLKQGEERAKVLLDNRIKENAESALYWSHKNLLDLKQTGKLDDKLKISSLQMLLRPAGFGIYLQNMQLENYV